jgi:hypothetical protein
MIAASAPVLAKSFPLPLIVERDDGRFQIGLDDAVAAGPFESRHFAEAVAAQEVRHALAT